MKKTKEAFRHEQKYLISLKDKYLIRQRIRNIMALDKHVKQESYTIRSLYFDDYWNSAYEDKQAGVLIRKKYRIRIYNYTDQVIKLERKRKHGAYIYKEDAPLTKEEFYKILDGDYGFLLKSPHQLCREFYVESWLMFYVHGRLSIMSVSHGPWKRELCELPLMRIFGLLLEVLIFLTLIYQRLKC